MTAVRRRRSLILRYTLIHGLLFGALIAGVLVFLYRATLAVEEARLDREIEADARLMASRLVGRTVTEKTAVVHESTTGLAGRTSIYLLTTERREVLAGNLARWPEPAAGNGLVEFPLADSRGGAAEGDAAERVRGQGLVLPDGGRLFVGRNLAEYDRLRRLFGGTLLASLGATVLLGFAGAFVLSRRLSSRLEEVHRLSAAILAGDLNRRMPVAPDGDEVDALSENLNQMLDRIEGLMAAMREVTDNVAHDLRSPLSRLRSRIEVALMAKHADAAARTDAGVYRRVLEQTVVEIDAILAVFNALLNIAEVESGAPRERFQELDLAEVAAESCETYEPVAEEAGLRLHLDAGGPVRIRGDRALLAQALANLLDNAIKYVPRGGRVTVSVGPAPAGARLAVADDGPGLEASFRARAFDRFSRMERSRTTPGSGLGLSLVRAVARLHGGDVSLHDAQPGLRVVLELAA